MKLNELKIGDKVIRSEYSRRSVVTVERLTEKQLIAGGERFRREDSIYSPKIGGDGWVTVSIHIPRDGELKKVESEQAHRALTGKLTVFPWAKLSVEELEKIVAALPVITQ